MHANLYGNGGGAAERRVLERVWGCKVPAVPEQVRSYQGCKS